MTSRNAKPQTRAFTLIESVVCIVVLALAVPPTLELLASSAASRADAVNTNRAAQLAELVLESCLADADSDHPSLGFAALEDAPAYTADLRARITTLTQPFDDVGITYDIEISEPVDQTGTPNFDEPLNIFRSITVTVTFPSARAANYQMPVSIMVGDL